MTIRSSRRPIIWSDMALRHSQALEELPRELVLMDWSYLVLNRFQPVVKLPSRMVVDETSLHDLTGADARLVPYLRAAPLAPPFPGIRGRPTSACLDALATAIFLREQGFDDLTALIDGDDSANGLERRASPIGPRCRIATVVLAARQA